MLYIYNSRLTVKIIYSRFYLNPNRKYKVLKNGNLIKDYQSSSKIGC